MMRSGSMQALLICLATVLEARAYGEPVVHAVAFSFDGRSLAGACDDGCLRVWRVLSGRLVQRVRTKGPLRAVAISPDGKSIAAGGPDRHVYLWGANGRDLKWEALLPWGDVNSVAFSPDCRTLACATQPSDLVRLLRVSTGALQRSLDYPGNGMEVAAFLPGGHILVTGGQVLNVWDLRKAGGEFPLGPSAESDLQAASRSALAHESVMGWTTSLAVGPRCSPAVAAGAAFREDAGRPVSVVLLDPVAGKVLRRLAKQDKTILAVAISADGKLAAAGGEAGAVRMWELSSGRRVAATGCALTTVRSLAFSPDGRSLAAGGEGGVRVFQVAGTELRAARAGFRQ